MNAKMKKRLIAVTGVIVIVAIVLLAVVGGGSAAKTVKVAEALQVKDDAKIEVTGNVVENSFAIDGNGLTFAIYDAEADPAAAVTLPVHYEGGVSATFGNDVTAICTGRMNSQGVLECAELVTKCPSKYESVEGALTIADLMEYGDKVIDKPVKVAGVIAAGTLVGVDSDIRFSITDEAAPDGVEPMLLRVRYDGGLPEEVVVGSRVVLTGALAADGSFVATNVALEG